MSAISRHGLGPKNPEVEQVVDLLYDEFHYEAGATLAEQDFFEQGVSKLQQYRNFTLPSTLTTARSAIGMKVESDLQLATTDASQSTAMWQDYFERNSFIYVERETKRYTRYPLSLLLSQQIYNFDGTQTVREKFHDFFKLAEPLEIPQGGRFRFIFVPAAGTTTAATGTSVIPQSYNTSIPATDLGFYLRLTLFTVTLQERV